MQTTLHESRSVMFGWFRCLLQTTTGRTHNTVCNCASLTSRCCRVTLAIDVSSSCRWCRRTVASTELDIAFRALRSPWTLTSTRCHVWPLELCQLWLFESRKHFAMIGQMDTCNDRLMNMSLLEVTGKGYFWPAQFNTSAVVPLHK